MGWRGGSASAGVVLRRARLREVRSRMVRAARFLARSLAAPLVMRGQVGERLWPDSWSFSACLHRLLKDSTRCEGAPRHGPGRDGRPGWQLPPGCSSTAAPIPALGPRHEQERGVTSSHQFSQSLERWDSQKGRSRTLWLTKTMIWGVEEWQVQAGWARLGGSLTGYLLLIAAGDRMALWFSSCQS